MGKESSLWDAFCEHRSGVRGAAMALMRSYRLDEQLVIRESLRSNRLQEAQEDIGYKSTQGN